MDDALFNQAQLGQITILKHGTTRVCMHVQASCNLNTLPTNDDTFYHYLW